MRYPVRLSAFAFELLMGFLKGARLLLPLGTINEHVDLQARGSRAGRCRRGVRRRARARAASAGRASTLLTLGLKPAEKSLNCTCLWRR
jgi:hypothetical protein